LEDIEFETTVIMNPEGAGKNDRASIILNEITKHSITQIHNKDTMCLGRSIVTAIVNDETLQKKYYPSLTTNEIRYVKMGRKTQETLARDLYTIAAVDIKEKGNDLDDVKLFESHLQLRIIIFTGNSDKIYSTVVMMKKNKSTYITLLQRVMNH